MKLALALVASASGMMGHGRSDMEGVHIGGGAFDPGTTDGLALWAIRKCKKKVCAVWPWAKCPLGDISQMGKEGKTSRGPCCHKCWNKCPPYLARHKVRDNGVFSNAEKRRFIKDEVWAFLQDDIECETSRLKTEFMEAHEENGYGMSELESYGNAQDGVVMMMNDPSLGGGENAAIAAECDNKYNWYQCQGHKKAHCCANTCLNNPDKNAGKCALCKCHGKCAYRDDIATTWKEGKKWERICSSAVEEEEEEEEEEE